MTMRSPLKQIPTCLWTTPRSLLVGGAALAAPGGSDLSEQCWWAWAAALPGKGDTPAPRGPHL